MTTVIIYLAHPLRGDVEVNIEYARMRLSNLNALAPTGVVFIAPWLAEDLTEDSDEKAREAGLERCCRVVERCDGLVACVYGELPSEGMRREMVTAAREGLPVLTLDFVDRDDARNGEWVNEWLRGVFPWLDPNSDEGVPF